MSFNLTFDCNVIILIALPAFLPSCCTCHLPSGLISIIVKTTIGRNESASVWQQFTAVLPDSGETYC